MEILIIAIVVGALFAIIEKAKSKNVARIQEKECPSASGALMPDPMNLQDVSEFLDRYNDLDVTCDFLEWITLERIPHSKSVYYYAMHKLGEQQAERRKQKSQPE